MYGFKKEYLGDWRLQRIANLEAGRSRQVFSTLVLTLAPITNSKLGSAETYTQMRPPPTVGINQHSEIRLTSIHWATTRYSQNAILASYLHHGIVYGTNKSFLLLLLIGIFSRFWDAHKGSMLHFISIKTLA